MVLFLLVILWVVVLFPPWWKSRNTRGGGGLSGRVEGLSMPSAKRPHSLEALHNVVSPSASDKVIPFRPRGTEAAAPAGYAAQAPGAMQYGQQPQPVGQPMNSDFYGPQGGRELRHPMSREAARRRRRNVVIGLFATSLTTLVLALMYGSAFTLLFLISDAVLLGFVMLVVQHERTNTESHAKVQPLRPPVQTQGYVQPAPQYMVRETAN